MPRKAPHNLWMAFLNGRCRKIRQGLGQENRTPPRTGKSDTPSDRKSDTPWDRKSDTPSDRKIGHPLGQDSRPPVGQNLPGAEKLMSSFGPCQVCFGPLRCLMGVRRILGVRLTKGGCGPGWRGNTWCTVDISIILGLVRAIELKKQALFLPAVYAEEGATQPMWMACYRDTRLLDALFSD